MQELSHRDHRAPRLDSHGEQMGKIGRYISGNDVVVQYHEMCPYSRHVNYLQTQSAILLACVP